jgi:hypothetical protein
MSHVTCYRLVSERTDGCATMLGIHQGCHVYNKKIVPQLPDLGGCSCHDACNCLKNGMKALNAELPSLWKAAFPCLEKASVKKTIHYKETCEELGLVYQHAPKYLEVRFRYTVKLALFFEENDRGLYSYFKEIADRSGRYRYHVVLTLILNRYVASGTLPSDNETTVINVYLGNYITTRLSHQFLIEVGAPFIDFLEFFESRTVRGHLLFPKMALLLHQLFSMFLKPGDRDTATPKMLLKVDYKDPEMQLGKKEVFVGSRVKNFMKKTGLTYNSPELRNFYGGITKFYHEVAEKLVKYFMTPLSSR